MQDNVSVLVATIVAVIIIVIFPIYNIADRTDSIAKNIVVEATTNFVDEVRNKGYITKEDYGNFLNTLNSTGNTYEVEMEIYEPLLLPTNVDDEYEEKYMIHGTSTILQTMDLATISNESKTSVIKDDVYYLGNGYKFYVRVKNTNITQAQILMDRIFSGEANKERIIVNYGGVVYTNDWASSKDVKTSNSYLKISRPINLKYDQECKSEYVTTILDEITGEKKSIYAVSVDLTDEGFEAGDSTVSFGFDVTYSNAIFKDPATGSKLNETARINKVLSSFNIIGFTANKEVTETSTPEDEANGNYTYRVVLSNITYPFGEVPYVRGQVYINEGSAYSEIGPLSKVTSEEFVMSYNVIKPVLEDIKISEPMVGGPWWAEYTFDAYLSEYIIDTFAQLDFKTSGPNTVEKIELHIKDGTETKKIEIAVDESGKASYKYYPKTEGAIGVKAYAVDKRGVKSDPKGLNFYYDSNNFTNILCKHTGWLNENVYGKLYPSASIDGATIKGYKLYVCMEDDNRWYGWWRILGLVDGTENTWEPIGEYTYKTKDENGNEIMANSISIKGKYNASYELISSVAVEDIYRYSQIKLDMMSYSNNDVNCFGTGIFLDIDYEFSW